MAASIDSRAASQTMDKKFAPNWHCIMGGSLGFEVTLLLLLLHNRFFINTGELFLNWPNISYLSGCVRKALSVVYVLWRQCRHLTVQVLNKCSISVNTCVGGCAISAAAPSLLWRIQRPTMWKIQMK
jgi:hypothetical protein